MSNTSTTHPLISVSQLRDCLHHENLVILDGSWYMPAQQRNPKEEYRVGHIPGAQFFDINGISDPDSPLPHTIPPAEFFASAVAKLGVTNQSNIVVYDGAGLFSAARVWWMFRLFGHDTVRVLDGGLPAWIDAGYSLNSGEEHPEPGQFTARFNGNMVAYTEQVRENCDTGDATILDARSGPRFAGTAPEPRAGLSSGHMPGAISLPFTDLLDGDKMRRDSELQKIFRDLGLTPQSDIITSCGSGVTAAVTSLALYISGFGMKRLYDGSWTEWASNGDNPIHKS